jgi:hypothetical protein
MKTNRANYWHGGDGSLIAPFSDGTATDKTWKAQSFYIAPLARSHDVVVFTRYPEAFAGARWIWSNNLVFDNLILPRKTVR